MFLANDFNIIAASKSLSLQLSRISVWRETLVSNKCSKTPSKIGDLIFYPHQRPHALHYFCLHPIIQPLRFNSLRKLRFKIVFISVKINSVMGTFFNSRPSKLTLEAFPFITD